MPIPPSSDLRKHLWIPSLLFLFFFRASNAFFPFLRHYDDGGYLAWLHALLRLPYPVPVAQSYFPGVALAWLPAAWAARAVALACGNFEAWLSCFIGLEAFLLWVVAWMVLDAWLSAQPRKIRPGSLILMLNVPVLYYATFRTHLTHVVEIALALAYVYQLHRRRYGLSAILGIWLVATRFNDAPALLLWLAKVKEDRASGGGAFWGVAAALIAAMVIACGTGYQGFTLSELVAHVSRHQFVVVMAGAQWGLIWTAPWWLLCLWDGLFFFHRLSWTSRAATAWMLLELILLTAWPSDGSDFAYRYLVGSYAGALVIWLETRDWVPRGAPAFSRGLAYFGAGWLTFLTWVYRTAPHYAYDMQAQALLRLRHPASLLTPLGLSPLGLLAFSHFLHRPELSAYRHWSAYALSGPALTTLWVATLLAVVIVVKGRAEGI